MITTILCLLTISNLAIAQSRSIAIKIAPSELGNPVTIVDSETSRPDYEGIEVSFQEVGTNVQNTVKASRYFDADSEAAKDILKNRWGDSPPIDCAVEGDDVIFLFESVLWSFARDDYDRDQVRYDDGDIRFQMLEWGIDHETRLPIPIIHGAIGGGYGLFGDNTYHFCVSKEVVGLVGGAEWIKGQLSIHHLSPLYTPKIVSASTDTLGKPIIRWSLRSGSAASKILIEIEDGASFRETTVSASDQGYRDEQAICDKQYTYTLKSAKQVDQQLIYSDPSSPRSVIPPCSSDPVTPIPEPPDPNPSTQCGIDSTLPGIILYQDRDYTGRCSHITDDTPNLGSLTVGDDAVSSIRVNGDYQVRLYEFTNYGGRYVEVNASDPNLDVTSLGEQFSSVAVKTKVGCEDENAQGIFLYSDKDYEGACVHLVTSATDLGKTAVGDNDVSSVRINGEYQVELFEYKDHAGRSDEINHDEPNLDTRSLGNQYSSVRVKTIQHCDNTSQPGVYIYSERNYGGNCAYLTENASDLDNTAVGNDGLRSIRIVGSLYVRMYEDRNFEGRYDEAGKDEPDLTKRSLGDQFSSVRVLRNNSAPYPPTPLYPADNADIIDGQFPSLCWQNNGDPEDDAVFFQVRLHSGTQEWLSDWSAATCWTPSSIGTDQGSFTWEVHARDDHYESKTSDWSIPFAFSLRPAPLTVLEPLTLSPQHPVAGETVVAGFSVKNTSGGVLTLKKVGVGVRGPGCTSWECDSITDFAWVENVTIQPDEVYVYTGIRSFNVVDSDYLVQAYSQDSNDEWRHHSTISTMAVSPGIGVAQDLELSLRTPLAGEIVTATYAIKNKSDHTIVLPRVGVIARGPNCTDWECTPGWNDFPYVENISIASGEVYTYTGERIFGQAGDGFIADAAFADLTGGWYAVPGATGLHFQVKQTLTFIEPLTLTPEDPLAGQAATVQFTIKNTSGRALTMKRFGAPVRGHNCEDWTCASGYDFEWIDNLTLQPEQTFTYSSTRTFVDPGNGWFVQAVYQDANDWWHDIDDAGRTDYMVRPGLQVEMALTLSPKEPMAGEPVSADFSISNAGNQPISIAGVMALGRAPGCKDWDCVLGVDFPQAAPFELSPGEVYVYTAVRIFPQQGDGYFLEPAFRDSNGWWRPISGGTRLDLSVTPGLELAEPLVLSPQNPQMGQVVTAEFTLKNNADRAISLPKVGVIARGPDCSDWECEDGWVDFPVHKSVTLDPGTSYTYAASRFFEKQGSAYFADAAYADSNPWWYEVPGNQRVDFTVLNVGTAAIIGAGGAQVAVGNTVTIPISLTKLPAGSSIGSASLELHFDPAFVEPFNCVSDPEDRFDLVECNTAQTGVIRISALAAEGVTGDVRFADVVFTAKSAASTLLDVVLRTLTTPDGTPIPLVDQDGTLDIQAYTRGDVSCDDATDVVDALFILQHDVGMRQGAQQCPLPPNTLLLPACDVTGDGACTVVDAMFVLQCDVGISNAFCPNATAGDLESTSADSEHSSTSGLVVISTGPVEQQADGRSVIPIVASASGEPVAALSLEIRYDAAKMKVVDCSPDPSGWFALAECNVQASVADDYGVVTLGLVDVDGVSGAFTLAEIIAEIEPGGVVELSGHSNGAVNLAGGSLITILEFPDSVTNSRNVYLPMLIR